MMFENAFFQTNIDSHFNLKERKKEKLDKQSETGMVHRKTVITF